MYRALGLALALLGPATGCAKAPPNVSPEAKVAWNLKHVLTGLEALQEIAIDAEASGAMSTDDAKQVVKATVRAAQISRTFVIAMQAGYTEADTQRQLLRSLRAVLQDLPSHLSPRAYDIVQPYLQSVISLLVIYGY